MGKYNKNALNGKNELKIMSMGKNKMGKILFKKNIEPRNTSPTKIFINVLNVKLMFMLTAKTGYTMS